MLFIFLLYEGGANIYNFIHVISAVIRQFILPNPFINWFENEMYADLFNIFVGGTVLWISSFVLAKAMYTKGIDDPTDGSVGYLFCYCYMTVVITFIGKCVSDVKIAIIVFVIVYFLSLFIFSKAFRR